MALQIVIHFFSLISTENKRVIDGWDAFLRQHGL